MAIGLRLLRVMSATIFCIVLFTALFELLLVILRGGDEERISVWGIFGWAMLFRAPSYLFFGTIPLTAIAFALDRFGKSHLKFHTIFWVLAGLIATRSLTGGLLVGSVCGYVYWLIAGRKAGHESNNKFAMGSKIGPALGVIGYLFVGFMALQLAGLFYGGAKLLWVTIFDPGLGEPPYKVQFERENTARLKVALMDFPDTRSCLDKSVTEPKGEALKLMDWEKIDNSIEARVCVFRLISSYGDSSKATEWLEAQGFHSVNSFSSTTPHIRRDGTLAIHAVWSIRNNGPKFPTRGLIRRKFASIPYGMSVTTNWSDDGTELLSVGISMNTL